MSKNSITNLFKSGRLIFAGTEAKELKVWDTLGNCSVLKSIPVGINKGSIKCISMSEDGYCIGLCGNNLEDLIYLY